jgi:hypothetical protein
MTQIRRGRGGRGEVGVLVLGGVTFVAALRAGRSRRALRIGCGALGLLFIGGGALVNSIFLATGTDYARFADDAHVDFVRDTWHSLVAPHQGLFIGMLVVFEATVGVLVLTSRRRVQIGLIGIIAMHIGLLLFGWVLTVWAALMLVALALLLRAQRRWSSAPQGRIAPPTA